jgi:hypothetical protein
MRKATIEMKSNTPFFLQSVETLNGEIKKTKAQITEKEKLIRVFVEDLHKLYTEMDSADWKEGLKQLYFTYVTGDSKRRITKEDKERMQGIFSLIDYLTNICHINLFACRIGTTKTIYGAFPEYHETKSFAFRRPKPCRYPEKSIGECLSDYVRI